MKLYQLKQLLEENRDKQFLIKLPDQTTIPASFHITEVGWVNKQFIDCGGKQHSEQSCQLQTWLGNDTNHRLNAGKVADILQRSSDILPADDLDVEIEYEGTLLSQYPVETYEITADTVTLMLTYKHTDCLAKDICLPTTIPLVGMIGSADERCTPGGGCC